MDGLCVFGGKDQFIADAFSRSLVLRANKMQRCQFAIDNVLLLGDRHTLSSQFVEPSFQIFQRVALGCKFCREAITAVSHTTERNA